MIDATAINDFRKCPEFYRQRHEKGLVPTVFDDIPLRAGGAVHAALEVWFSSEQSEKGKALEALRKSWGPVLQSGFGSNVKEKRPLSLFERIIEKYAEVYPREDEPFKIVKNEEYLEASFNGFDYCGIVDRVIQFPDGSTYLMDTKTTSGYVNDNFFDALTLSTQFRGYIALLRKHGTNLDGVFVDTIHVDTRYQNVKTEHFVRRRIGFDDWMLKAWEEDVRSDNDTITDYVYRSGYHERWPQRDQSCMNYNKRCMFYDLCRMPQELADEKEKLLFKVDPWEPKKLRERRNGNSKASARKADSND